MKLFAFLLFSFLFSNTFGQITQEVKEVEFKGICYNEDGNPYNPGDPYIQRYSVKKHKKTTQIEINIKSIKNGNSTLPIEFQYSGKLKNETHLLKLTDNIAIKFLLARVVENGSNIYLYKMPVFRYDNETNCWRTISTFTGFYEVYSQSIYLNGYRIGNLDSDKQFTILEGYVQLD